MLLLAYSITLSNQNESLNKELDLVNADLNSKNTFLVQFKNIATSSKTLQDEFIDVAKEELEYLGFTSEEVANIFKSKEETLQSNENLVVDFIRKDSVFDKYDVVELNKLRSAIDSSNQTIRDIIKNGVNKKYAELSFKYDSIKLHEKANAEEAAEFKMLLPIIESGSLKSMIDRLHEVDSLMIDNQALNDKVQNRVNAEEEIDRQRIAAEQEAERKRVAEEQAAKNSAASKTTENSVYYKNCTAVRAARAAPIYEGQPGYGTHLDRDKDGIGCE